MQDNFFEMAKNAILSEIETKDLQKILDKRMKYTTVTIFDPVIQHIERYIKR